MNEEGNVSRIASLLADPARATILRALIDGTMRPAGELAHAANVSAQSASAHLAKLMEGGLLSCEAHGRYRYFRIASAEVADTFETLAALGARIALPDGPRLKLAETPFMQARTCYDHLAGQAAVRLCEAMLKARWLAANGRDFTITKLGNSKFAALGVDVESALRKRRSFARACVDLTQRRPHLGGALGAALLSLFVSRGWVLQNRRSRVVAVTPKGNEALATLCE